MNGVLHHLQARVRAWLAVRAALGAIGTIAALALAAALTDAALDLPETARASAPWILAAAIATAAFLGIREARRLTPGRLARRFERLHPELGNRLINAVQLARQPGAGAVEEFFRREAVELGRRTAADLKVWSVVKGGLNRAGAFAAGVVLAWAALLLFVPGLCQAVLPRYLDVRGDHPPYSRLKIQVAPGPVEVLYGGQVEVRVTTRGRPVDKLWLVATTGTNVTRTIMFLAPDKSFFLTLANLRERTEYCVTDGAARSRRFLIDIRYTPQITLVEVTTDFPDYTGRPARTAKLAEQAPALPEDTRVTFRVASNRPLKSGRLDLTPVLGGKSRQVELQPAAPGTLVTGAFTFTEAVAFHLAIRDVNGLDCAEPRRGRFNLLPDQRPRLFVVEPGRDAVATPTTRIPVRVEATDDYGVARVLWLRGHNRSIERPFQMRIALRDGQRSVESAGAFELEQLGVRPGDAIEYYFEAADNYPKGPNVALSRPFRLEIISQAQFEAILRQAAARQALFEPYLKLDAWLRRLAETARGLESRAEESPAAARAEAEALAKQLEDYTRELGKLLREPALFDVEQSFRTTLVVQHTRLGQAAADLRKALGSGRMDSQGLKELGRQLGELAGGSDEMIRQPAQHIAAVARLVARADRFVTLAQQQAALAQMLRRFAEKTGPLTRIEQMELQELMHLQRRVQLALQDLLAELPDLASQVPNEPGYDRLRQDVAGFVQAVTDAGIVEDLGNAAAALDQPDTVAGQALAQIAAEKMDRLVGKCQLSSTGRESLEARFKPTLSKASLGKTLDQILSALGAGSGEGGQDGYSLFNRDVALYGANVELTGEQAARRGDSGSGAGQSQNRLAGDGRDPGLPLPDVPARVRLQPDTRFPLRYRDLVGEYFRVIAESDKEGAR